MLLIIRDIRKFLSPIDPTYRDEIIHIEFAPIITVHMKESGVAIFLQHLPVLRADVKPQLGKTTTKIAVSLVKRQRRVL